MLKIAGSRGAYGDLKQAALGGPLPWPDGHFRAFFSTGVFTISHAPASGLHELARITRSGGHAIFTVRDQVLDSGGFRGVFAELEQAGEMAAGRGKPVVPGLCHRRPRCAGEDVRVRDRMNAGGVPRQLSVEVCRLQPKHWYEHGHGRAFRDPGYKSFVLQDHKRLPARFFARISGALISRLS